MNYIKYLFILSVIFHLYPAHAENSTSKTVTLTTEQLDELIKERIDKLINARLEEIFSKTITLNNNVSLDEEKAEYESYSAASKKNTINAFEDFLSTYPRGSFTEVVQQQLIHLKYSQAKKENSIAAYTNFISNYPNSENTERAFYKRALLIDTIEGYDQYMQTYPEGSKTRNAKYQKARIIDSVITYNDLLENVWPNDRNIIYYRDKAALEEAKKIGNKQAFEEFIEKYPKSQWLDQAKYFHKYGYDLD